MLSRVARSTAARRLPASAPKPAIANKRLASSAAETAKETLNSAKETVNSATESVQKAAHHANKSDTPWIAGALLVWVPCLVYLTSPQDAKDKVKHHVAPLRPSAVNYGVSRKWKDEPEDEEPKEQQEEEEAVPAAVSESDRHGEIAAGDRPFQGDESFKTVRDSHPGGNTTLEDHQNDSEHEMASRQKTSTEKGAATLQPDAGKLSHAAKLAQSGHSHDPKAGLAEREKQKKESGKQIGADELNSNSDKTAEKDQE